MNKERAKLQATKGFSSKYLIEYFLEPGIKKDSARGRTVNGLNSFC